MRNYAKALHKIFQATCFGYLLELPQTDDSNKYSKDMFCEEMRIKQGLFLPIFLSIKDSLQKQIHYNGNVFGNKCCLVTRVHCISTNIFFPVFFSRHFH